MGNMAANVPGTMGTWIFNDSNPNATAGEFTVTANWGDGTGPSTCTVTLIAGGNGSPTQWLINAPAHTYTQDSYDQPNGRYQITVTVTSSDGNLNGIQYASVVRTPMDQYTGNVDIASSLTVSNSPVAIFTVPDGNDAPSEFSAQIDWGDGTGSGTGTIQELSPGLFEVLGNHSYAVYGWYWISVTVSQNWSNSVSADLGAGEAGGKPIVDFRQLSASGYKTASTLSVGKWRTAFENENQSPRLRNNFLSLDPERFYVRVQDPIANKNMGKKDTIRVYFEGTSDTGHSISLTETGVNTGIFLSSPLLLTTFSVDKAAGNNQTLYVKLGDTVSAIYGEKEVEATVPVVKVVHLSINILRVTKGGNPVATTIQAKQDVWNANRIYAAAGIRFIIDKIQYVGPPDGVDLSSKGKEGLACRFYVFPLNQLQVVVNGQLRYRMTDEEKALTGAFPANQNVIRVYYVNYFSDKLGTEEPLYGESFPVGKALEPKYANSVIISAVKEKYQTLAHEIGHVLLNSGSHDPSLVNLMFGSGTRGDAPPLTNGEVTDSRRITPAQAKTMQNNAQLTSNP